MSAEEIEEEVKIILRASKNSSIGQLYAVRSNGDILPIENWYDSIIVTGMKPSTTGIDLNSMETI